MKKIIKELKKQGWNLNKYYKKGLLTESVLMEIIKDAITINNYQIKK